MDNIHSYIKKLQDFAKLLQKEQVEYLQKNNLGCQANIDNTEVSVKQGNKYVKIDVGDSGKYMIDREGNIFGIKAYGVIHRGHFFGTLDTISQYYWGGYKAFKKG